MKVSVEHEVNLCNECPFCREHIDTTVCFDSFDEPNYEFYCTHKEADNTGSGKEQYNNEKGKFIGLAFSKFDKDFKIQDWCPFKKNK
jgi:hypothetical protein